MKKELLYIWILLKRLYKYTLDFKEGTDIQATIEGIKRDISFRGPTAWILIFSILIASIGLNVNSIAVIIGAMLISPLMGPILGIGMSVGTNDFETLIRSLKNLAIAFSISLFTSTLYFVLTPLNIEQTELLARTKPTLLDVLVALFGGFAGIIAGSRKEKSNVIPGVAIATALMPPLCTAGYGLATLKLNYFFGAFYLFFINSVFISLSTFIVVRYLKFPIIRYVSREKMKRYKIILLSFLIITIIPSVIIFYEVIQETRFKVRAEKFIAEKCVFEGSELITHKIKYHDTLSVIDLYYIGQVIDNNSISMLHSHLPHYGLTKKSWLPVTKSTMIKIHQEGNRDIDIEGKLSEFNQNLRINILEDIYSKNEEIIKNKDHKIKLLEDKLVELSKKDSIPFRQIAREITYHFPEIGKYSFAHSIEVNETKDTFFYDTIPVFLLRFNKKHNSYFRNKKLNEVKEWLHVRLSNQKIQTLEY
jgi:uncharacterized hydrophobic protein (TIGR00271 family)